MRDHVHGRHKKGQRTEERIGRLLGHGDLRYLILFLLDKKPRHGYEIIKSVEELSSGAYSPSPGSIYPTLTFLEEGGFADSALVENKKLYSITKQGRELLEENKSFVSELIKRFENACEKMSRLKHWVGREEDEEIASENRPSIRRSMHRLKTELFAMTEASGAKKRKVVEIIDRAVEEIRKLKD